MASISTSECQSVFDIAIRELGSCEAAFLLALENGLSVTDELEPGTKLVLPSVMNKAIANYFSGKGIAPATYSENVSPLLENIEVIYWTNDFEVSKGVKVSERQSVFDISVQKCGSIEAALELALLNGFSITDELESGQLIQVPDIIDNDVVNYFAAKKYVPESVGTQINDSISILEGIDYWAIDVDFVVS